MNATKLAALALAGLLVSAGAVLALPGAVPDDVPAHDQANDRAESAADANETTNGTSNGTDGNESVDGNGTNVSDGAEVGNGSASENGTDGASARGDRRGPPTEMPEKVPDHVVEIHQTIGQFLDGAVDHLGRAIRGLTPGGNGHGPGDAAKGPNDRANAHARG